MADEAEPCFSAETLSLSHAIWRGVSAGSSRETLIGTSPEGTTDKNVLKVKVGVGVVIAVANGLIVRPLSLSHGCTGIAVGGIGV